MRTQLALVAFITSCSSRAQPAMSPPPPVVATPVVAPAVPKTVAAKTRSELEAALAFEGSSGDRPQRWTTKPEGTIVVDTAIVHGGRGAIRIQRTATTPD